MSTHDYPGVCGQLTRVEQTCDSAMAVGLAGERAGVQDHELEFPRGTTRGESGSVQGKQVRGSDLVAPAPDAPPHGKSYTYTD